MDEGKEMEEDKEEKKKEGEEQEEEEEEEEKTCPGLGGSVGHTPCRARPQLCVPG